MFGTIAKHVLPQMCNTRIGHEDIYPYNIFLYFLGPTRSTNLYPGLKFIPRVIPM